MIIGKILYKKSKLYSDVLKLIGYEKSIERFLEDIDINLQGPISILDLACGSGVIGLKLLERFPYSSLLACDIEEGFLKKVIRDSNRRNIDQDRINVGISDVTTPALVKFENGKSIKIKPRSFNIVSIGAGLGYSKNQKNTLKILQSFIKPGGYFINIEMNETFIGNLLKYIYGDKLISIDSIKDIISENGFHVKIMPLSFHYFPMNLSRIGIVAKKIHKKNEQ